MSKPLHEMLNDLKDDYEARLAAAEREVERWKSVIGIGTKVDAERIKALEARASRLEEALRYFMPYIEDEVERIRAAGPAHESSLREFGTQMLRARAALAEGGDRG